MKEWEAGIGYWEVICPTYYYEKGGRVSLIYGVLTAYMGGVAQFMIPASEWVSRSVRG